MLATRRAAAGCLGTRGRFVAAVACFGAGGGERSPGVKSKIGSSFSRTLLRSARPRPSGRGIQVPDLLVSFYR